MQTTDHISTCPQFFKAFHVHTLSHGKIEIPKRYVERYGSELLGSNAVLLKLPDGKKWEMTIKVTKSDRLHDTVWIENGWQEFAQYYHLSHGSLLFFRKNGSCCFDVAIFDLSATEIDYPVQMSQMPSPVSVAATDDDHEEDDNDDEEDENDDSVENISGSSNPNQKSQVPSSSKAEEDDDSVEIISGTSSPILKSDQVPYSSSNPEEDDDSVMIIGGTSSRIEKSQVPSSSKAGIINDRERAKASKSSNPFFKVKMRSSYIGGQRLAVPLAFAKKHGSVLRNGRYACLCVAGMQGTWKVKYRLYNRNKHPSFTCGWDNFVEGNSLKEGDICVFELVAHSSKLTFKVTINRV